MKIRAISAIGLWCLILCWLLGASPVAAEDAMIITKDVQSAILRDLVTPKAGAANPDVVLVEYFDFNCPFCKRLNPALQALLKADIKVALVYKEWPILGATSVYAAGLALAANWQGKYLPAHDALMDATRLASNAQVDDTLSHAGLDMNALKRDRREHAAQIEAVLERNNAEAHVIGVRGTPGLLIGRRTINGVYEVAGLELAVAGARRQIAP